MVETDLVLFYNNKDTHMTSNAPLAHKMALELVTLTLERLKVPVTQESIAIVLDATELVDVMESRLTMFDTLNDCESYILNSKIRIDSLDKRRKLWKECATKFNEAALVRASYESPDFATVEAMKMFAELKQSTKKVK